jgi:endonuclease IV
MDLHRRRSVLVPMTEAGQRLETVRIVNDPDRLAAVMARAGEAPEVVLEATYGWYWAADTLPRAGCLGVVVHAGSAVGEDRYEEALRQLHERLLPVLDGLPDGAPRLLVEPTAGGGKSLAATVEDLGPYLAALEDHPLVGVCFDTCHAWAAGHDLSVPGA